jgi:mRNA-degrading endonuclease toxin of MazEF toxin-antitoxin module
MLYKVTFSNGSTGGQGGTPDFERALADKPSNWAPRACLKKSRVKIAQIRTLAVDRIGARIGLASPEELQAVPECLKEICGL